MDPCDGALAHILSFHVNPFDAWAAISKEWRATHVHTGGGEMRPLTVTSWQVSCFTNCDPTQTREAAPPHSVSVWQDRTDATRTSGGVFIGNGLRSAAGSLTLARRPSDARTPMRSGRIIRTWQPHRLAQAIRF